MESDFTYNLGLTIIFTILGTTSPPPPSAYTGRLYRVRSWLVNKKLFLLPKRIFLRYILIGSEQLGHDSAGEEHTYIGGAIFKNMQAWARFYASKL